MNAASLLAGMIISPLLVLLWMNLTRLVPVALRRFSMSLTRHTRATGIDQRASTAAALATTDRVFVAGMPHFALTLSVGQVDREALQAVRQTLRTHAHEVGA